MRTLIILLFVFLTLNLPSCATRVVSQPNSVTVFKTRPASYKIVRVHGKHYYFWNGNHYRKTKRGYVFVRL